MRKQILCFVAVVFCALVGAYAGMAGVVLLIQDNVEGLICGVQTHLESDSARATKFALWTRKHAESYRFMIKHNPEAAKELVEVSTHSAEYSGRIVSSVIQTLSLAQNFNSLSRFVPGSDDLPRKECK